MGVTKHVLKEGTGAIPKPGDTVTIQYTGWLKDTTKGDTLESQKGQPIRFFCWDEGVTQMKLGEKATLDITPDYAYGARDVELQKIN
ncbi:peptidyl-prolyl cis-trans isomerase fkr-3 [Botrytis cinerea]